MSQAAITADVPWYRLLNRSQWNTLIAANLGWMFDGYETYALVVAVGAALRQLLEPTQYDQIRSVLRRSPIRRQTVSDLDSV
jgi:hypothetical protein